MERLAFTLVQLLAVFTWSTVNCSHRDVLTNYVGPRPRDCAEVQQDGYTASGVYHVFVGPNLKPIRVFCDLENQDGGWLVFQRRQDGFQDFQRYWDDYAEGFGDVFGEFWLGNHLLHLITNQKAYRLRVDLEDFDKNTSYAEYSTMSVDAPFEKYRLHLGEYSGDAGNSMLSNRQFSTIDQDNDEHGEESCAAIYRGGWWYGGCHYANLNGLYLGGEYGGRARGMDWKTWRGYRYSLKTTVMKLRPVDFVPDGNDRSGGN